MRERRLQQATQALLRDRRGPVACQTNAYYVAGSEARQTYRRTIGRVEGSVTDSRNQHSLLSLVFIIVAATIAEFVAEFRACGSR